MTDAPMIAVALLLSLAAACAGGTAARQCQDAPDVHCIGAPECEWDEDRGCEVCTCPTPEGSTPVRDIMDPDQP